MSDAQQQKGKLLFVAESADECFRAELLAALRQEGLELVVIHDPRQLIPLYYQGGISLIVVFGEGK